MPISELMATSTSAAGRWVAGAGVAAGVASVVIRSTRPDSWGPMWLAVPALVVEWLGLVGVALLVWAAFVPRRRIHDLRRPDDRLPDDRLPGQAPIDVVVRIDGHGTQSLRATLISAPSVSGSTVVLDLRADPLGRSRIAAVAREYGARYVPAESGDQNGLSLAATVCRSPMVLLLDAGDVASSSIVDRLAPHLDAHDVAAVQGLTAMAGGDSPEHRPSGRHERTFERRVLTSWLGARGCAPLGGSGALIRRSLLADVAPRKASPSLADGELTAALFASGWRIVAQTGDPVVALRPPAMTSEWEATAADRTTAARHLVFGLHGALRINRLEPAQRLALLAWSVRPLSGARRGCILALVLGALLGGRLPYRVSTLEIGLTAAFLAVTSAGLALASGGALLPGDRARFSVRTLGASWRGILSPDGRTVAPRRTFVPVGGRRETAGAVAVGVLAVALAMRGLSDRVTHTLHPLPGQGSVLLMVVTMWIVEVSLDSQRLLPGWGGIAVHRWRRRGARVVGPADGGLEDVWTTVAGDGEVTDVRVLDLTVFGAAVELPAHAAGPDSRQGNVVLHVRLPDETGRLRALTIDSAQRHCRHLAGGRSVVGLEFTALDRTSADALVRHCVVRPAREALWSASGPDDTGRTRRVAPIASGVDGSDTVIARRGGLRAATLVALAGAAATAANLDTGSAAAMLMLSAAALTGVSVAAGLLPRRAPLPHADASQAWQRALPQVIESTPPVAPVEHSRAQSESADLAIR